MNHRSLLVVIVVVAIVAAFIGWASTAAADHTFTEIDTTWAGLPPPTSGSLTVAVAGLDDAQTREALRTWNAAVGWELFTLTAGRQDVVIAGGDSNNARSSARHCKVTVYNNAAVMIAHELGHCLGLADHLAPSCEPEAYRGLMSYCTGHYRINGADLAALRRLGYRTTCTVTVQNGGPLSAVVSRGACSVSDVLTRTNADIVWALVDGRWEWGPRGVLDDLTGTYALYAAGGTE